MATAIPDLNLLFLAIPKTGTEFVIEAFRRAGFELASVGLSSHALDVIHQEPWKDMVTFTVVREREAWLRSIYGWCTSRKSADWIGLPGPAAVMTSFRHDTYESFRRRIDEQPGLAEYVQACYTDQAAIVLHTEQLGEELANLMEQYGVDADFVRHIPRQNVTTDNKLPYLASE